MNDPKEAPTQRRGRLLYVLLFGLVFTGFVPVFFVAQKLIGVYQEELRSTLGEKQFTLAAAISETLDTHLDGARARVGELSAALGAVASHSGGGTQRRLIRDGGFLEGFLGDDLILVRFQDRNDRIYQAESSPRVPRAWLDRLLAGGSGGDELISQPRFIPEIGIPVLVITRPVTAGKRLTGVVSCVFNLQPIWSELVQSLNVPYTAYVMDREGHLFAHTDPEKLALPVPRHYLVERFLDPTTAKDRETAPFKLSAGSRGDVTMLGTKMATRQGWGIFVQVEEELAFAPATAVRAVARRWQMLTLALGIGVAVLFAGYLTRPIHRLAEAARAFARGEFDGHVEVRARNELGFLADTFNAMSDEIRDQLEKLREAAEENRDLFLGTIRSLAAAIDEKDPYTRGHSERVNRLSMIIGKHLGLSDKELDDLNVASLLHDLGKIGIDDRILRKPAALTDEEFEMMKQHPGRGANILEGIKALEHIVPGLKHHHERWVGGGYPDGLKGEEIPLHARIIQIADSYDAMTTNRPYQRAMRVDAAVARINELSGKISDPKVVEAFNRAYKSGDLEAGALRPGAPTARAIRERTAS